MVHFFQYVSVTLAQILARTKIIAVGLRKHFPYLYLHVLMLLFLVTDFLCVLPFLILRRNMAAHFSTSAVSLSHVHLKPAGINFGF